MQNGIAGKLRSAALTRGRQPTTMIERGGFGSLGFIWSWRDPRTGIAAHRVTSKKKSRSALMRSGSAMAGQKARKTSSGRKRSKNCETRINRPPSARPPRERNLLESNAERRRSFCLSQSPSSGDVRAEVIGASSPHPRMHSIAALASRLCSSAITSAKTLPLQYRRQSKQRLVAHHYHSLDDGDLCTVSRIAIGTISVLRLPSQST
jgi:hypothetical protein